MSKVVGVGLDWGQVLVTKFGDVKVFQMGQKAWQDVWENVLQPYVFMDIELPSIKEKRHGPCSLTTNDSSKKFGIGMCNPNGGVHMYVEDKKQEAIFYPIIWELVQYMTLNHDKGSRYESIVKSTSIGGHTKQTDGETSSESQKSSHNGHEQSSEHGSSSNQHHIARSKKRSHGGTSSQSESPNDNEEEEPDEDEFPPKHRRLEDGSKHKLKKKALIVKVYPASGGNFIQRQDEHRFDHVFGDNLPKRIKNAIVSPELIFKFEILGNHNRLLSTATSTMCSLGKGAAPMLNEGQYLGYYQDNITIDLSCIEENATKVLSRKVLKEGDNATTILKTTTTSKSVGHEIGLSCEVPLLPSWLKIQGGLAKKKELSDSLARSIDVTTNQVGGFDLSDNTQESSLNHKFLFPRCNDVLSDLNQGKDGRKRVINSAICQTFWPIIIGEWGRLNNNEACPYVFTASRDLTSIEDLKRSTQEGMERCYLEQHYEVPMFVNNAMSHIHLYDTTELHVERFRILDHVLEVCPTI
ncbi:unnamed protein product [Sphagnum compactum]